MFFCQTGRGCFCFINLVGSRKGKRIMGKLLKISEIAREVGVLPSTIRYYSELELIQPQKYTRGGQRLYDLETTRRQVKRIQYLVNNKGIPIREVKKYLQKKRVLVVDDEPEVGNLISDIVQEINKEGKQELEVQVVYDGFSAGKVLGEFLPDIVILDLMLPGVNGFEVCQQIRKIDYLDGVKILAVTGYDSEENRRKIFAAGADDYLAKPMDIKVLKEKILKAVK